MRGAGVALVGGLGLLVGCGGETPATAPPIVELTVGALVPGSGRSSGASDWAAAVELATTDVNTALARVNAGCAITWRR